MNISEAIQIALLALLEFIPRGRRPISIRLSRCAMNNRVLIGCAEAV